MREHEASLISSDYSFGWSSTNCSLNCAACLSSAFVCFYFSELCSGFVVAWSKELLWLIVNCTCLESRCVWSKSKFVSGENRSSWICFGHGCPLNRRGTSRALNNTEDHAQTLLSLLFFFKSISDSSCVRIVLNDFFSFCFLRILKFLEGWRALFRWFCSIFVSLPCSLNKHRAAPFDVVLFELGLVTYDVCLNVTSWTRGFSKFCSWNKPSFWGSKNAIFTCKTLINMVI